MRQFDALIWDMDGTLLDTLQDLADATNYILRQYRLPERSIEEIRQFVGNGVERLLELAVPQGREHPAFSQMLAQFLPYYQQHCNDNTRSYPGITAALRTLSEAGMKMAVVSNKPDFGVQALSELHFPHLMDAAVGVTPGLARKPAPDMVELAISRLQVDKSRCVYIGDSEVDLLTAKKLLKNS